MKMVYPVIFTKTPDGYVANVPDMNIGTQGKDLGDAIEMVRDAIGLAGISLEDDHEQLPTPSKIVDVPHSSDEIVSMVDIDFAAYRRANDRRTVRRNVSLPSWLNDAADKAGINVSAVLQAAIKKELRLSEQ